MKKYLYVVLFILPVMICAQTPIDYFPLGVGDYWIQHGEFGEDDPRIFTMEIEGTDLIDGDEYARKLNQIDHEDGSYITSWYVWLREDNENILLGAFGEFPDIEEATIFDPPHIYWPAQMVVPGSTWSCEIQEMGGTFNFQIISNDETVTVPAGTFHNCLQLDLVITNAENDTTQANTYYYAENVGEVKNVGESEMGDVYLELVEYDVQMDAEENDICSSELVLNTFPNPFHSETTISFKTTNLHKNSRIEIFNIKGQKINQLRNKNYELGINKIIWDGRDDLGKPVSSGIYFYQLQIGERPVATKRCLLIR